MENVEERRGSEGILCSMIVIDNVVKFMFVKVVRHSRSVRTVCDTERDRRRI